MTEKHANNTIGILITNLGTPEAPNTGAVMRYLREFLSDRRVVALPRWLWWPLLYGIILPFRSPKTAVLYQQIWQAEGSPLLHHTRQQGKKLKEVFSEYKLPVDLRVAMRYGQPNIKAALAAFKKKGIRKLLVLPLYPQYAASTVGSTFDAVAEEVRHWPYVPEFRFIAGYADNQGYIQALAQSVRNHWQQRGRKALLLMSFHGLPKRSLEQGDPYYCFCHKTARLLAEALGLSAEAWRLVFQSRFGRAEWLQPYCEQSLVEIARQGVQEVDVICPGFSSDCLETLQEIKREYASIFLKAGGGQLHYVEALNAQDNHINVLTHILKSHMHGWLAPTSLT